MQLFERSAGAFKVDGEQQHTLVEKIMSIWYHLDDTSLALKGVLI